ncbi:hypothetical protein LTR10_014492 [Elasticomyces elasticus]|uniref:Transcription factor domain-containing protein n=1 Tax=Exophiala sideris TaxID=1016849 RepID=A0ABR0J038_9EURO|nr:hypothetical protein LTR10_014492 [Elasticomyces elasticus]KAK5023595.1 hypothetical protein LTS07_009103 [Exophiala sideris]KAK5029595.1 hypothetical protein LTR13_008515 [Exophiala sideris]KAK5053384.1 hypothetical protein LTR69_009342 [Exophiala sideris]KAK5179142.1 hypothetical protein LTR44_008296 [Eurotiomycetes sp. CCFEE 6388]
MRLLFVPYRTGESDADASEATGISRQKHAAREHHRKAKVLRQVARGNRQKTVAKREGDPGAKSSGERQGTLNKGAFNQFEATWPLVFQANPQSFLGAGRLDPFDTYHATQQPLMVHEIFDHAISYQWSLLAADSRPESLAVIQRAMTDMAMNSPLCFNTLIYAGATHKAFYQSPVLDQSKSAVLRLSTKLEIIRGLQASMQSAQTALTDETVFAMLILGALGKGEGVTGVVNRDQRPLAAGQDGDFYASMEYEWKHMDALMEIVKLRGGLSTIRLPGLAFTIASFDIHTSILFQRKPSFPLVMPSSLVLKAWATSHPKCPASLALFMPGTGSDFLLDLDMPPAAALLRVLDCTRDVIIGFESYERRDPSAPDIKAIIFARNLNQHELLSLPDLSDDLFSSSAAHGDQGASLTAKQGLAVYELCRLSAIVFQIVVLLPNLHAVTSATRPYAQRLIRCLEYGEECLSLPQSWEHREFLLWVTMFGAWLCKDINLRDWFIDFLNRHAKSSLPWKERYADAPWQDVAEVMSKFLWLQSECGIPCRNIWEEAMAFRVSAKPCVSRQTTVKK